MVRQLEATVGSALLRTGPDERLRLTAYSRLFLWVPENPVT